MTLLFTSTDVKAQLTGTKNIPGDYPTLNDAITALNTQGVGAGGVILNLVAGNPQTAPAGGYVIGGTGSLVLTSSSSTNTIVFQGNGNTITAPTPQTSGNLNDAIFKIIGADWVTLTGFTMNENAANTTTAAATNNMTEWGVALLYVTTTDGAQNVTIQNNTITLNRTYQNTFGIYSNSTHTAAAVSTSATATGASGANSNLKIYANNISNVNLGIVVVGPTGVAEPNLGLDIGGSSLAQGNTLTNFGTTGTFSSYINVSGTVNGILVRNSNGFNISYNSITSSVGGTTAGTLNGIQIPAASTAPTTTFTNTITNNTISLQSGVAAGAINGITYPSGSASTTSAVSISSNNFTNLSHTVAASGAIIAISCVSTNFTTTINNNTFTNITCNTTGSFTFIAHSFTIPANGSKSVTNNSIVTGFSKTGAGGTVTCMTTGSSSPNSAVCQYAVNNFSNITVTGATAVTGINDSDGSGSSPTKQYAGNTISNITGGTSAITCMTIAYVGGTTAISNNTFTNITGQGAITGLNIGSSANLANPLTVSNNTIANLTSSGTGGAVTGLSCSNTSAIVNINSNNINTLSSTGASAVQGIVVSGAAQTNVFGNKIYDLSGSNASSTVSGLTISGGTSINAYNNLIGNLSAPIANAANPVNGLNITGGTTVVADYNTVYINATSSGALFGSSAVSVSTSPNVTLRNNIFVNTSTPSGSGLAVAHRRSTTTATTYSASSNNNLFYAGVPSSSNLIFTDGTNNDQTIAAYKARFAPKESQSISEAVNFLSTSGSASDFLHINTTIATQIEGGGVVIAAITTDYDGNTRSGTLPDIGADEFSGIPLDLTSPAINYALLNNTSCLVGTTLSNVVITDATGVQIAAGIRPRLYYKKTTNANTYADNTSGTDGWKYVEANGVGGSPFTFSFNFSLLSGGGGVAAGDTIQYFVVAQDIVATPNVGLLSGVFAASASSVNLSASQFPITGTINSFRFVTPGLSGTKTIGAAGDYATITGTGGLFEAINNAGLSANVTANIIDASVTETGAVALNAINYNGCAAGPYTLTIKPNTTATLTGSVGTGALIKLNGADYVTIDGSNAGGSDRSLTIQNLTTTTTGNAVIWLAAPALGNGSNNNTVKNSIIEGNAATTTFLGAYVGGSATISLTAAGSDQNNNNTFQNNLFRKTQNGLAMFGYLASTPDLNNTIINNAFGTATAGEGFSLVGINVDRQQGMVISGNEVQNITNATTASNMIGIRLLDFKNGLCFNNNVHDILYTGTSTAKLYGIALSSSTYTTVGNPSNATIYNNTISKLNSSGTSATWNTTGLLAGVGYGDKYYYNSVHLTGQLCNSASGLVAAFANGDPNITGTGTNIDVRNNIFNLEGTSSTAGGNFWAFYSSAASLAGSTVNYNDLVCAGTNATNNIGRLNSVNYTTLSAWQTASGQDANSFTETPLFTSTTNLHINSGMTQTRIESGGTPVSITTDIDGQTRPGPAGSVNGGGTNPDVGADEFDGFPALPMSYTSSTTEQITGSAYAGGTNQSIIRIKVVTTGPLSPLTLTSLTLNANGTTDIANINASAAKVYYTGSSTTFSTSTLFGSAIPTLANFNITGSQVLLPGNNYFWLAYDVTAGSPSGNNIDGECTSVTVGSAFTPTVTAPAGNKTILGPLNGTYMVGTGQTSPNFATLTEAISDLNGRGVSGPVVFNLLDASYSTNETFPLTINQFAGTSPMNPVLIKPMTSTVISGTVASGALIRLNGADYITIDGSTSGGTDRSITITNASTTASSVISIASLGTGAGAVNNTIKNCNLSTGVAGSLGYGISVGGSTPGTAGDDNDNTTLQNNSISVAPIGIYATATSTGPNDNLNIIGNTIVYNGTLASIGIQVGQANNSLVSQNSVDEQTSATQSPTGISLETGFLNSSVTRNNILRCVTSNTGGYGGRGITVGTGSATSNVTIANNFISGINGSNWTGFSNSSSMGIAIGMIGNSSTITTVAGGINIYYNSVNMYGNYIGTSTTANKITAALYVGTGASALDVRNNVFVNSMVNTSAVATSYAIYSAAANTAFTSIDFNDYFVSGSQGVLGFIGSNRTDLAGIIAGFGQNASSVNADPKFISSSDLHISTSMATIVESKGTPIATVTLDIDNNTRNASTPDIGADEGTFIALVNNDVQATAFVDPVNGGSKPVGIAFTPMASFTNNGLNSQTNVPVRFRIVNASMVEIYNQTGTIASMASGGSFTQTFPAATLPLAGTYTMYAKAELVGDQSSANDEISGTLIAEAPLCGTYAVGASQPSGFQNLTQAFTKINSLGVSCAVVYELQADYSSTGETFPLLLSNIPGVSAVNTFTLKPAAGVNSTISGSIDNNALIRVQSDYVTIEGSNNGSNSRNLTLTNTSTTTPSVVLIGSIGTTPRLNVTLKNCNVTNGINTASAVLVSDATTSGNDGYFNNITVQNNLIKKAFNGIYARSFVSAGNGSGLSITNNDLTSTGADAISFIGIYLQGIDGGLVSGNSIGNFNATGAEDDKGIWLATGVKNTSVLSNKITNIGYTGTSGYGGHGIYLSTAVTAANILVANNMIANMYGDGWTYTGVPTDNPIGIALTNAQTGISVYHNSIFMSGNTLNQTDAMSMGIYLGTGSEANIRNNIIVNNLGLQGATGYGASGIYAVTSNAQFTDINYNDYVVAPTGSGNKFIGQIATTGSANLAAWQTATGKDANSVNITPVFTSSTDLHLIPLSNVSLNNLGTPIAAVITDIDGDSRDVTTPDLGCDEYTPVTGCTGQPSAGSITPTIATLCTGQTYMMTATGLSSGSGINYQWKSGPMGGPYTNVSGGTGANTATYTTPVLSASTTYYVLETTCTFSSLTNQTNAVEVGVTGDKVINENNSGTGSLRKAIECTASGDTVFISSGSVNLINLLTQLNVDKPLLILDDNGSPVMLKFDFGSGALMSETNGGFKVSTTGNVTLDNIHVKHVANDATHPVIKNEGILTLKNSKVTGEIGNTVPPVVQNAAGATINAEGSSEIKNE